MVALEEQLATLTRTGEILRVEIRRPDGTVVAASEPGAAGTPRCRRRRRSPRRTGGQPRGRDRPGRGRRRPRPGATRTARPTTLIREDLPIETGDRRARRRRHVARRRARPRPSRRRPAGRRPRHAQRRAASPRRCCSSSSAPPRPGSRGRPRSWSKSTRRDPLTGSLNHGALVAHLADEIERAAAAGPPLGVALVDIDNFRLLNDNHGHGAGDEALLAVAGLLGAQLPTASSPAATARTSSCSSHRPGAVAALGAGDRPRPDRARRPQPPVRGDRAAADHDQRRHRHLSRPRRVGHAAARRRGRDAPGGEGERRRRGPRRPAPRRAPARRSATLRRPPGPRPRGRHEGPLHEAPLRGRRPLRRLPRRAARPAAPELVKTIRVAGPAPRRRQDRHPRRDPPQAGQAHRRRVRDRQAARRARRRDRPRPARRRARPGRHPPPPRALGRRRLSRPPRRRGDPADRPDPGGRRRVLGDDDDAAVPQGARRPRGAAPARGRGRQPARRGARPGVRRRASRPPRTRRCPGSSTSPRCGRRASRDASAATARWPRLRTSPLAARRHYLPERRARGAALDVDRVRRSRQRRRSRRRSP